MLGRAVHAGRGHVVLVAGFELDGHRLDVVAFAIFGVRFFVEATVAGCADVVGEVGALRHRDVGFGYDVGGRGVERVALWTCVVRGGRGHEWRRGWVYRDGAYPLGCRGGIGSCFDGVDVDRVRIWVCR